jgi:ABC-2 type transport system ATP-binding protein
MPELLRALDSEGITMTSMQVHRPTLDDVFLTMTGRSLRDAEEAAGPATGNTEETSHVA